MGEALPSEAVGLVDAVLSDRRVCTLERANLHAGLAGHLAKTGEKEQALRHIREAETLALAAATIVSGRGSSPSTTSAPSPKHWRQPVNMPKRSGDSKTSYPASAPTDSVAAPGQ
ncbi:hypothetical protein [Actinokineospora globicatena]|uniref:hypothetical protein n=1 Tax=Actinokineospora globicatena TaxID=103729 RepID=UPI0025530384|nr:hypothetical protein [Actinokineospora globicatena]